MVNSRIADWRKVTFNDAFSDITAKAHKVDQSEFSHSGTFPIVDQGQDFIAGYTDDEELVWHEDLPVVIFGDHTRILKYIDFPFVLGADGTKVLKPIKDVLPLFAYYQLLSLNIPSAGYSRHFKFLKEFTFRYPPLSEQKRIASLVARADRLRQLRRTAHDLGDTLLQSVFLEMFGDVVQNEKGWEKAAISDLGKVHTGNTPSREKPEYFGDFIEWIKSDNIRDDQLYVSQSREMLSEIGMKMGRKVEPGSVLVTCIAGSLDHIGDTAIIDRTATFNQQINAITPYHDVNPLFLRSMLHIAKPYVQYNASAGMKHIITKSRLEELILIRPPLSLQEEFARVVARVDALRGRMVESARQAEGLFQSLLSEAFQQ